VAAAEASGARSDGLRLDTEVTSVGELAGEFFDEGWMVLFGEEAPEELAEYSVLHRPVANSGEVTAGDRVEFPDGQSATVLAVGSVAGDNLRELGHLVLKRNGQTEAGLPGDVCCDEGAIPAVVPGQRIRITAGVATGADYG